MGRKLLMLGGADIQVTAIQKAKSLGYTVYTCDYLPGNPGHAFGDGYHNVSTTDKEAVLDLARKLGIDGISAYASDPAAVTAAFVSERMGLPGNSYAGTCRIQDKVSFRAVQRALGVPCPGAAEARETDQVMELIGTWPHGGIIKPVDTSGSKGIHHLTHGLGREAVHSLFEDAMGFSRAKRLVIEEFLPRKGRQMTGDALIVDGRLVFWCFGDVHFNDRVNGLVPRGVTLPGSVPAAAVNEAMADLQRVISELGLRQGVFNIDLFIDDRGRPITVDVGARNGGNMLNTLYHLRTGVDLMEISLRQCMGEGITAPTVTDTGRFVGHIVLHALHTGILRSIGFSAELEAAIFYRSYNVKPGDRVGRFVNSGHRAGLLLVEFQSLERMHDVYDNIYEHMLFDVAPDAGNAG